MLRVDQVHIVRFKVLVEGVSQRQVARQLGISRNTVAKYLQLSTPARVENLPRPKPALEKVAPRVDALLEEWRSRTTAKQRITGRRLHRQLLEEGYKIGITTLRAYLREKRRRQAEVYIPLVYRPGEVAQVDFFEVAVEEAGVARKVWKFLMHLMYSGYDFVWLYDRCDQTSFLDGHVRAFTCFGGVPHRLVYDNLSAAVRRFIGNERQLTDRFTALASHYLFEPCFARPGEGHDKGGMESRGKAIRLQHLVPVPRGETLRAISEALLADLHGESAIKLSAEGESVIERFEEESKLFRPLPSAPFEPRHVVLVSVSSKATVQIEAATYSVPSGWARLDATAYVGVEDIHICCLGKEVFYPKQRPGIRHVQYRHYLPELARQPQAVRQVAPELIRELGEPFGQLWQMLVESYGGKEAGRVLAHIIGAIIDHGEKPISEAIKQALAGGRCDLFALGERLHAPQVVESIPVPESLRAYEVESGRVADYDWLLTGGGL